MGASPPMRAGSACGSQSAAPCAAGFPPAALRAPGSTLPGGGRLRRPARSQRENSCLCLSLSISCRIPGTHPGETSVNEARPHRLCYLTSHSKSNAVVWPG